MIPASLVLLAAFSAGDTAKAKAALDKRLTMPLSPGAVALLAPDATNPAVVGRLAEALRDANASTRAAAARVVTVAALKELENSLDEALDGEFDAEAAREEIRAVAVIASPPRDERLIAVSDRFEGRLDPDLARILARQRGRAAIPLLLSSRRWNLTPTEWADALWLAARHDPEAMAPALARALGTGDRPRWDALLRLLVRRDSVATRSVVAAGLHSPVPGIAARSAWYLAWARLKEPLDTDRALIENGDALENADLDTAYQLDLLHRTFSEPAGDSSAWIASLATRKSSVADDIGPGSLWLSVMTPAERDAVRTRYDQRQSGPSHATASARSSWEGPSKKAAARKDYGFGLRTISGLPRGVPADALKVGDCRPRRGQVIGVTGVLYGPDGRPRQVRPYETDTPDACEAVGLALAMIALAPDDAFPIHETPDVLVGIARSDCLAALEEPDVCPSVCPEENNQVVRVTGNVEPPVLEDRVEPFYRESLRRAGKQGVVTLEAIIGTNGCVQDVTVVGPADPGLDFEAARAVSQWKYRPARLDGRAIRVYLDVTVTFKLH